MKISTLFACLAVLTLSVGAWAGDKAETVTVKGNIACAKCTLKVPGADGCQSVLVVEGKKDASPTHYYLVKNDVTEAYGHVCEGQKAAKVTGTIAEDDGQLWLTATKMKKPRKS